MQLLVIYILPYCYYGTAGKVSIGLYPVWFEASPGALCRKIEKWLIDEMEETVDGKAK
jgi:hypothetical protein